MSKKEEKKQQTEESVASKKQALTPEQERERALNRVKRMKKLKHGTLATVLTALFVAVVVVCNIIVGMLNDRYNWSIDLTSSGLYEIDERTISYLNQLDADIEIVVMADEAIFQENSMLKVVAETLNRFKSESNGHISVKYINLTENPDAFAKYTEHYNGELVDGDLIVASGDLVRVVAFDDIIATEQSIDYSTYSYVYNYTFVGEQSLLSAIMGVTDLNPINVAVFSTLGGSAIYHGYDTYNVESVMTLLEKNNYHCTELDISNDALDPAEYQMAVLCAPSNDLTQAQVDKLSAFLYNDGNYERNLLYFASPYQGDTPTLDAFLEAWGISVGDAVIYEGNASSANYVMTALDMLQQIPTVTLSDSAYAAGLANTQLPIVAPLCRPLELLYETNSGRTTEVLLSTSSTSYLYPLSMTDEEKENFTQSKAETGSYVVAALGQQHNAVSSDTFTSSVAVFGTWFMDTYVVESSSYNNADYFVTVVNTLCGKENGITIAEKSLDTTTVTITDAQVTAIRNVTVFIIPLIVAVIGIVVFVRRRNK